MSNNHMIEVNYIYICKCCNGQNLIKFNNSLQRCAYCQTKISPTEKIYRLKPFLGKKEIKEVVCPYCNSKNYVNTDVEAVICESCNSPFSFPELNLLL
jgi:uncharacterized Zn-finger protein